MNPSWKVYLVVFLVIEVHWKTDVLNCRKSGWSWVWRWLNLRIECWQDSHCLSLIFAPVLSLFCMSSLSDDHVPSILNFHSQMEERSFLTSSRQKNSREGLLGPCQPFCKGRICSQKISRSTRQRGKNIHWGC